MRSKLDSLLNALTCNDHHANREDPLVIGFCGHVPEPHGSHARHREIKGGDVHRLPRRSVHQLRRIGVIGPHVRIRILGDVRQLPEPVVLDVVVGVRTPDGVPDAGQPVGHQHVEAQQEDEHRRAVLQITVELADDASQAQETHHF